MPSEVAPTSATEPSLSAMPAGEQALPTTPEQPIQAADESAPAPEQPALATPAPAGEPEALTTVEQAASAAAGALLLPEVAPVEPVGVAPAEAVKPAKRRTRRRSTKQAAPEAAAPAEGAIAQPAAAEEAAAVAQSVGVARADMAEEPAADVQPSVAEEAAAREQSAAAPTETVAATPATAQAEEVGPGAWTAEEPAPETVVEATEQPNILEAPAVGVEILAAEARQGELYFTVRDLRNCNTVHNVTAASARKLWSYAINQYLKRPTIDPVKITWSGDYGLLQVGRRAKKWRYDLVRRQPDGRLRVYYGVTADGMDGPWAQFLQEEDRSA